LPPGTFTANIPHFKRSPLIHDCTAVEISSPMIKLDSGKANGIDEFSIEILKA